MDTSSGSISSNSAVVGGSSPVDVTKDPQASGSAAFTENDPKCSGNLMFSTVTELIPKGTASRGFLSDSEGITNVVENFPGPYRDPVEVYKPKSDEESTSSESEQSSQGSHRGKPDSDEESTSSGSRRQHPSRPFKPRPVQRPSQPIEIELDYVPRLPQAPLPSVKLIPLGEVTAFFDGVVVIKSYPNVPALDKDSALYFADRKPMGLVYDIFGPVRQPMYAVVYENRREIRPDGGGRVPPSRRNLSPCPTKIDIDVKVGDKIYCADDDKLSIKVLTDQIEKIKAYDEGDSDEEFFSDDEEERKAKGKIRPQRKTRKSTPRRPKGSQEFRQNHLSSPFTNSIRSQIPQPQHQQQAYQSYSAFCQQRFTRLPGSYTGEGGGGEPVRFSRSHLEGPLGPMVPPQQPLPCLTGWPPGQVNFLPNTGFQFPGSSYNYPYVRPFTLVNPGPQTWDYPPPPLRMPQPPYMPGTVPAQAPPPQSQPPRRRFPHPHSPSGIHSANKPN